MSTYKIHKSANGTVKGFGPNADVYQPYLSSGDYLDYSDTIPEMPAEKIKAEISALEARQTSRRIREAALSDDGRAWLQNLDEQIAAKRAELAGLE